MLMRWMGRQRPAHALDADADSSTRAHDGSELNDGDALAEPRVAEQRDGEPGETH